MLKLEELAKSTYYKKPEKIYVAGFGPTSIEYNPEDTVGEFLKRIEAKIKCSVSAGQVLYGGDLISKDLSIKMKNLDLKKEQIVISRPGPPLDEEKPTINASQSVIIKGHKDIIKPDKLIHNSLYIPHEQKQIPGKKLIKPPATAGKTFSKTTKIKPYVPTEKIAPKPEIKPPVEKPKAIAGVIKPIKETPGEETPGKITPGGAIMPLSEENKTHYIKSINTPQEPNEQQSLAEYKCARDEEIVITTSPMLCLICFNNYCTKCIHQCENCMRYLCLKCLESEKLFGLTHCPKCENIICPSCMTQCKKCGKELPESPYFCLDTIKETPCEKAASYIETPKFAMLEDTLEVARLAPEVFEKEKAEAKILPPIIVQPMANKIQTEFNVMLQIMRQCKTIIDFEHLSAINDFMADSNRRMLGSGLSKEYGYNFKFGFSFTKIMSDIKDDKFREEFKDRVSRALKMEKSQIKILNVERGCVNVCVQFMDMYGNNLDPLDRDGINRIRGEIPELIQIEIASLLGDPNQVEKYYEPNYNVDYRTKIPFDVDTRGQMPYPFPLGWYGFAIKVVGQFDNGNDDWLSMEGIKGEWAVGFYPTSRNELQQILNERSVLGQRNKYKDDINADTYNLSDIKGQPCGVGIYLAQNINDAEPFATPFEVKVGHETKTYKVVFQCRVQPEKVRIPSSNPKYYILNNAQYVRPYRFFIKEIKD